jgi:hypothetical protein
MTLMGRNLWLEWEILGQYWFDQPDFEGQEGDEGDDPHYLAEREMEGRMLSHNSRVERLRVTTRKAAVVLLRAARPLLSALPASIPCSSSQPSTELLLQVASLLFPCASLAYQRLRDSEGMLLWEAVHPQPCLGVLQS